MRNTEGFQAKNKTWRLQMLSIQAVVIGTQNSQGD